MTYPIFQYPLPVPPEPAELNAWLANRRVVSAQHHVLPRDGGALHVFIVQSVDAGGTTAPAQDEAGRARIDYKKVLDPETFARLSRPREERKRLGAELGVPVCTLVTNARLAVMAATHPATLDGWRNVEGGGADRIGQFGDRLLASLNPEYEPKEQ